MTEADPRALERVGAILNEKWTLERLLGVGGMGAVYAARHRNGARAAVKVLHPDLARLPVVRERFLREGYAANSVEHRGAVKVLDDDIVNDGPDAGSAYLVMELLEGESLDARSQREPKLNERDLLDVIDSVLDVLAAAHEHGVIHRDLKPENIFLATDPDHEGIRVKVLDFGLARLTESGTVTSAGVALGTPSFMSPEQAGGGDIDARTDIFALGATAFRIITERRIHDASNMVALVIKMATQPAPRLRTIAPDISEPFARIVDRALMFEREERYPDAKSMQADVKAALGMIAAGEAPSLHIVPFSARGTSATLPAVEAKIDIRSDPPAPPPPPPAPEPPRVASDPPVFAREEPEDERRHERDESGSQSTSEVVDKPRSSSLPYLFVAIALALVGWKFGPVIQAELVRRASLPVRTVEPPPPAPPVTTTTTTTASAPIEIVDAASASAAVIEDAGIADDGGDDDDDIDAGAEPTAPATPTKDGGREPTANAATSARPHPSGHPNRPPTKRPGGRPHKRRR